MRDDATPQDSFSFDNRSTSFHMLIIHIPDVDQITIRCQKK